MFDKKVSYLKIFLISLFALAITIVASFFIFNYSKKEVNASGYSISLMALNGDGTAASPYVIDSSDDLTYMATQCNNNAGNYRTAYYVQVGNLTCPSWTKITTFSGNYDGRGYTISGFSYSSTDYAFFHTLESSAVVKNVGFTNVSCSVSAKGTYSNAVIAIDNYGTISNCFVTGYMKIDVGNNSGKRVYVGALVAHMRGGSINNCYNAANIDLKSPTYWTTTCYLAGIACEMAGGTVNNCYNIGLLNITNNAYYWALGGIAAKDEDGGVLYNCAVLRDSCKKNGSYRNDFFSRYSGSTNISTSNCAVVDAATLKNMGAAPLSSWEWNSSNNFPRTWGFAPSSSSYYNSGYPQLRVFYESFTVNVYNEAGNTLLGSKTTRYPEYAVNLSSISIPAKRGHTFVGEYTSSPNSTGSTYTQSISSICTSFNVYATYDVNYYRLRITNPTPLAGTVSLKDEMVAYDTPVTLTATSNPGYRFIEWRYVADDSVASVDNPCVFNMIDSDIIAYAHYMQETYAVKVYINNTDYGSVTGQYDYFNVGQTVTLNASANLGYKISKFYLADGTVLSTGSSYSFTMPRQNREIYVDFVAEQYSLSVVSSPSGVASISGGGSYKYGDEVNLSVSNISSGYKFASWKVGSTSATSFATTQSAKYTMPASNTTIYCQLIETSKSYVSFLDKDGNVVLEHVVENGATVGFPNDIAVSGYNFLGWYNSHGDKVTSLTNITSNVVLQATYEKIFDCEIEASVIYEDNEYSVSDNFTVFFSLNQGGRVYAASVDSVSQLRVKLINFGAYSINVVLPTYYDYELYVNYEKNTSNTFDVLREDELVILQFIVFKTDDYLLYDSNFRYGKDDISDVHVISPIVNVAGQDEYLGIDPIVNNFEYNQFSSVPTSPSSYELKDVIGGTNWGGLYNFTSDSYLQEGANFISKDLGSSVYKVSLANHYQAMYPFNTDWGTDSINNMTDLAKSKPYKDLFENPGIKTYVLVAYEFVYCPWERVLTGDYTLTDMEIYYNMVRTEFSNLTNYLLSTYSQAGKTFILSNWEGDNAYGAYYDMCTTDAERQLLTDSYVGYINARQDGIIAGRKNIISTANSSVVYGNFEVNHIGQNIPNVPNRWRLVDVAVPKTYCDLYSISDWYSYLKDSSGNYMFPLESLLDQLYSAAQNNLSHTNPSNYPSSTFTGGKNVMVTEFGYDENTDSEFYSKLVHEVETAINWGVYKLVYWGIYSNVRHSTSTSRPQNKEMQGLWLIRPDGSFSEAFWYLKSLISGKDFVNSTPNIIYTFQDNSGVDWDYYKNKIIFKDDLTDSSKLKSWSSNNLSFYTIDPASDNYSYFQEFNYHYGSVDTTGLIQNSDDNSFKYISYDMHSNAFGILLYSYNNYLGYTDLNSNPIELLIVQGKNKAGNWEKINNINVKQYMASRADGNLYWMQNYLSGAVEADRYSELRIVFSNKGYNSWDPIISSVVFFEGGVL